MSTIPWPNAGDDVFLSQLQLNPSRPATQRLLASPQRIHAAVLAAFPDHQAGDRVLWRLESTARHDVRLLVASPREPDFTSCIESYGWPMRPDATWRTRPYTPFLSRLASHQVWAFRLRGNPVVRKRDESGRVHTIPHLTATQQRDWLVSRAEHLGVSFPLDEDGAPQVTVSRRDSRTFTRNQAERGRRVTIASAQFDGLLEVVDAERLRTALIRGVGRAKAYGCGLLTLVTPPSNHA
nr:type I-E CRISPR-associated protein Cas6/Cse3/CasE [uncultured Aeromicrobium sp.]